MPALQDIHAIGSALANAAQTEYDAWEQDENGWNEELGEGGICHLIADQMVGVLNESGIDATSTHSEGIGENHVWVTARTSDGVVTIDIPPSEYEIGSGYSWRKRPGIQFSPQSLLISVIDPNPTNFYLYADWDEQPEDNGPQPSPK